MRSIVTATICLSLVQDMQADATMLGKDSSSREERATAALLQHSIVLIMHVDS